MANKNEESKNKETSMNTFPIRGFIMMLMGIIFGGATVFGYIYIVDVHWLIPGPTIGRFRYLLLQIPPLWWVWITSGLFTLILLTYILGRTILRRSAFRKAQETLHWKTREAFRYYKGKAEETEGRLEKTTAERNSVTEMASEFQAQLLAIDRIRASMPRNEIVQHRLMELKKKEPKVIELEQDEPVLTFTRKANES
jgi:hypothetical protein